MSGPRPITETVVLKVQPGLRLDATGGGDGSKGVKKFEELLGVVGRQEGFVRQFWVSGFFSWLPFWFFSLWKSFFGGGGICEWV